MKKLLVIIGCVALVSLANCSKPEHTLTLLLNNSGVSDGDKAYAKLVAEGADYDAGAEYSGSGTFISNNAAIIIEDIEEDSYTLWVYVDTNDDQSSTGEPYYTADIDMDDDITLTINTWN